MIKTVKPRRIIDYIHRGKVKTFVVNVGLSDGYIRLEYPDYNINREHNLEWVKFRPERLIKEYSPTDEVYRDIISIWWTFAKKYIERRINVGLYNIGTHHLRDMFKESVKEVKARKEVKP